MSKLVIVESPHKATMIKKYLGKIMSHFIKTEMKGSGKYFE